MSPFLYTFLWQCQSSLIRYTFQLIFPSYLSAHANQIRIVGPSTSTQEPRLSDQPPKQWTNSDVVTLMASALEPQLESKLKQKRHLDRLRIQQIVERSQDEEK